MQLNGPGPGLSLVGADGRLGGADVDEDEDEDSEVEDGAASPGPGAF